jgi:hypothetical protein
MVSGRREAMPVIPRGALPARRACRRCPGRSPALLSPGSRWLRWPGCGSDTQAMTRVASRPLADRLERVAAGLHITPDELADLAGYSDEVQQWASELETRFADFAANAGMLSDEAMPDRERAVLRRQMRADAEAAAGALRTIGSYILR